MQDESKGERLASRAVDVVARFGVEKVMGMWEEALMEAATVED